MSSTDSDSDMTEGIGYSNKITAVYLSTPYCQGETVDVRISNIDLTLTHITNDIYGLTDMSLYLNTNKGTILTEFTTTITTDTRRVVVCNCLEHNTDLPAPPDDGAVMLIKIKGEFLELHFDTPFAKG
jgi:hypothetical protein